MSVGSILNTALRSMQATQLSIAVSSNNIANAQTPGYSRQRLITRPAQGEGDGSTGTGIDVVRVESVRNQLIDTRLKQETAKKSQHETLSGALSDIEVLFNESNESGFLPVLTKFFNSFHALSADPSSTIYREEIRTNAQSMADSFKNRGESLRSIQSMTNAAIADDVARANDLIAQIATVTVSIKEHGAESSSNELHDQRSILVRELSKLMEVRELEAGTDYHLTTSSNRLLALNGTAMPLTTEPSDDSGLLIVRSGQADITNELGPGQIKANLELRDRYLPKYMAALDTLAYDIVTNVNAIHSAAYDLNAITGINFFTPPDSSEGAPRLMTLSEDVAGDPGKIAAATDAAGLNNLAAIDMGNLLHNAVFTGGSVTDQYGNLVSTVGSDVLNAASSLRQHEALEFQLENRRSAISGVSIDEETVQMLGFQRAYEASARLVRTVDEMLQTLLAMGG